MGYFIYFTYNRLWDYGGLAAWLFGGDINSRKLQPVMRCDFKPFCAAERCNIFAPGFVFSAVKRPARGFPFCICFRARTVHASRLSVSTEHFFNSYARGNESCNNEQANKHEHTKKRDEHFAKSDLSLWDFLRLFSQIAELLSTAASQSSKASPCQKPPHMPPLVRGGGLTPTEG